MALDIEKIKTESLRAEQNRAILIGNFLNENYGTSFAGNVYDQKGLCPTLRSSEGGHKQPHIITRKTV